MFSRNLVGFACVLSGSASNVSNPISDAILAVLNGVLPEVNPEIDSIIPDPLNLNVGASGGSSKCITSWFHHCMCHASYDYSVGFGTIHGLKEFKIAQFTNVNVNSDYVGTVSVQFGGMNVGLTNGKAHGHAEGCGIGASGDGTASAQASFTTSATLDVKGILNEAKKCVSLSVSGSTLNIAGLNIHDAHVDLDVDGISFPLGGLVSLIQGLDPKIDPLIENEIKKVVVPLLTKEVSKLGCINIPIADVVV